MFHACCHFHSAFTFLFQSPCAGLIVQIGNSIPSLPPGRLSWTVQMMWRNLFLNSSISQSFWKIKIVRYRRLKIWLNWSQWRSLKNIFQDIFVMPYRLFKIHSVCVLLSGRASQCPGTHLTFQGSATVK